MTENSGNSKKLIIALSFFMLSMSRQEYVLCELRSTATKLMVSALPCQSSRH